MAQVQAGRHAGGRWLLAAVVGLALVMGLAPSATASLVGQLSGTVTGAGRPLVNVWVTLIPVTDDGTPQGTEKQAITDAEGRFEFPELYDRAVKLLVRAPPFSGLVDTYYPDAPTLRQAQAIEISTWPVVADVDLPTAGSATGRVIDLDTGAPIDSVRVTASLADEPSAGPQGFTTGTGEPGGFALSGLPPADLMLRVVGPAGDPYLDMPFRPGAAEPGVRIDGREDTTDVVVGLRRGAEIRGTVRDDTGAPVAGASIKVIGCLPYCPLITTSDETGSYRITGIRPASRLGVVAWRGEHLLRQWYPGRDNASRATDLDLTWGQVRDGVDFSLTRAAFVTVDVRDARRDEPLRAIVRLGSIGRTYVQIFTARPGAGTLQPGTVDGPGVPISLRVGPVPPGEYTLRVSPGVDNPGYLKSGWVAGTGLGPDGRITLRPGEEARALVRLIPAGAGQSGTVADWVSSQATPEPGTGASGPGTTTPAAWPGLSAGFLAPGGLRDPFAPPVEVDTA